MWLDHICFEVTNYKETTDFYAARLGWKPTGDEGSQMGHVSFGIAPWDTDPIKAELSKRILASRHDTGGKGDIHNATKANHMVRGRTARALSLGLGFILVPILIAVRRIRGVGPQPRESDLPRRIGLLLARNRGRAHAGVRQYACE